MLPSVQVKLEKVLRTSKFYFKQFVEMLKLSLKLLQQVCQAKIVKLAATLILLLLLLLLLQIDIGLLHSILCVGLLHPENKNKKIVE